MYIEIIGLVDMPHRNLPHSGMAKKNNAAGEWVYVPKGTCAKITGGKVIAVKKAKKK